MIGNRQKVPAFHGINKKTRPKTCSSQGRDLIPAVPPGFAGLSPSRPLRVRRRGRAAKRLYSGSATGAPGAPSSAQIHGFRCAARSLSSTKTLCSFPAPGALC